MGRLKSGSGGVSLPRVEDPAEYPELVKTFISDVQESTLGGEPLRRAVVGALRKAGEKFSGKDLSEADGIACAVLGDYVVYTYGTNVDVMDCISTSFPDMPVVFKLAQEYDHIQVIRYIEEKTKDLTPVQQANVRAIEDFVWNLRAPRFITITGTIDCTLCLAENIPPQDLWAHRSDLLLITPTIYIGDSDYIIELYRNDDRHTVFYGFKTREGKISAMTPEEIQAWVDSVEEGSTREKSGIRYEMAELQFQ